MKRSFLLFFLLCFIGGPASAQKEFSHEVGSREYYAYYKDGKWGLKYNDCTYVHPQYDNAAMYSPFGQCLSVVCRDNAWFVVNEENRPLFQRSFEDIKTQAHTFSRKVLKAEYREKNAFGHFTAYFKPKDYEEIPDYCEHFRAENIKTGSFSSDELEFKQENGWSPIFMAAKENGKWGYVNGLGEWVIDPIYDEAGTKLFQHKKVSGIRFIEVKRGDKWLLIDVFGTPVYESEEKPNIDVWGIFIKSKINTQALHRDPSEYETFFADLLKASIIADSLAAQSHPDNPNVVPVKDESDRWGLRDTVSDKWIVECKYDRMFDLEEGVGAYRVMRDGKYGLVNVISGEVIPCIFNYISPFDERGDAISYRGKFQGKVNVYGYNGLEKDLMQESRFDDLLELNANNYFALRFLGRRSADPAKAETYFYAAREVCKNRYDEYMVQENYGNIAHHLGNSRYLQEEAESSGKIVSVLAILSGIVDATNQMYMTYQDIQYNNETNGASSDAASSTSFSGGNYQSQYAMWERRAKANYESLTNLGYSVTRKDGSKSGSAMGSMNTGNYTQMKKALREAQNEMARIRRDASKEGINIQQSKWETATVEY